MYRAMSVSALYRTLSRCCHVSQGTCMVRTRSTCFPFILKRKYNVCVEGNIGSGKTTFLEYFRRFDDIVEISEEPVNKWRNLNNYKPLDALYKDPMRWSFTFQSYVMLTLLEVHNKSQVKPVHLMERSLYSVRHCFVENLYQSGLLSDVEYKILCSWFNWAIVKHKINVDLIVYIRTSPETAYERIRARKRPEEQNIALQYLKDLHKLHDTWLCGSGTSNVGSPPVLIIDGDQDRETMKQQYTDVKSRILFGVDPCQEPTGRRDVC